MHKVLIVDDEKPVRIAISKLGQWSRWHLAQPEYAENGREALKILSESRPALVFVDMQMPVMDGTEFLRRASKDYPDTAFIVISGYDEFTYAQSAIRYGVKDYILKPVDADKLNEAIERVMRMRFPNEDFSAAESAEAALTAPEVVALIRDTIDTRYAEQLKVRDFADRYYFSQEYLTRLFRQQYGKSIIEYLTDVRMERARALLQGTDLSVTEISARVGYTDKGYFSRVFRDMFDQTPKEYRMSSRTNGDLAQS